MQGTERDPARTPGPAPSSRMLPMAPEGWVFILVPLAVAVGLRWLGWPKVAVLAALLAVFMAFFFRAPERTPPPLAGGPPPPAPRPPRHPPPGRRRGGERRAVSRGVPAGVSAGGRAEPVREDRGR